jgi:hypothetical protein
MKILAREEIPATMARKPQLPVSQTVTIPHQPPAPAPAVRWRSAFFFNRNSLAGGDFGQEKPVETIPESVAA